MFSHRPKAIPEEEAGCEAPQVFQGFAARSLEEEEAAESMCACGAALWIHTQSTASVPAGPKCQMASCISQT